MANEKLITLRGLTKFRSNLALENKVKDIYDFYPYPYRWTNGKIIILEGNPVQACANRMFKLTKDTVVILKDVSVYDISIHCFTSTQELVYNSGWITLPNDSVLSYNFFKNYADNTEYFTFMFKRKDGQSISISNLKNNFGVYIKGEEKVKLKYNIFTGTTFTDGIPGGNQYRACSDPILFDENIVIDVGLIGGYNDCLQLNFNCFDENGAYLGKTGYFEDITRSITGYDIKQISGINTKIKYVVMLVRNNAGTSLNYNSIKNNVSIYLSKQTQILNKQQTYAPYSLLSPMKNNAFVYSICDIGKSVSNYRSQGIACYNETLFAAYYKVNYDANTKILVCDKNLLNPYYNDTFIDLGIAIHAPSINFGEKQDSSDDFPLLYISVGERTVGIPDPTCLVYKITVSNNAYSAALVKTIDIGFTNDADLWGNSTEQVKYAVSVENNLLILFKANGTTSNRIFVFSLPTADKTLQTTDILYYFDIPYTDLCQDICIKNNLLYVIAGRPENDLWHQYNRILRVIDIFDKKELGRLNFKQVKNNTNNILTEFSEQEGIDFIYENRLLISQTNYSVLFVVDIRNSNIDNDFIE